MSRAAQRPHVEVYPWTVRQPLPTIPVPLAGDDPEARLDLQAIFTTVYDRAGYAYAFDYRLPPEPPLSQADAIWMQALLTTISSV